MTRQKMISEILHLLDKAEYAKLRLVYNFVVCLIKN